jgi:hypothetical protein
MKTTTSLMVALDENGHIIVAQHGERLVLTPGYNLVLHDVDIEIAKMATFYKIEMDGFTPKLVALDGVEIPEQPERPKPPVPVEEQLKELREENQSLQMALLDLTDMFYSSQK